VRRFAAARDWQQFHSPKNLAMALAGEVGELLAELQWLTDAEVNEALAAHGPLSERLASESADVLLYLVNFADVLDLDLLAAASAKLLLNEKRYPIETTQGRTRDEQLANLEQGDVSFGLR
jgi:dCTP diphosphatase